MPAQYCDASSGTCYEPPGLAAGARITAAGVAVVRMCNFSGVAQTLPSANYSITEYGQSSASASLAFPQLTDGSCSTLSVPVPGVTASSAIALGLPAALEVGLLVTATPTAAGSVGVTACNWSGATLTPATAIYQFGVM